ncbi:hypothetical protein KUTeg_010972 [Tegillarca granosa]|uniref:C2H2-type domain-containing protein n=1 Tax=Tegillarca granosa TaxID=220873 RepID=A0ABQ9F2K6_TEGGR|nr:hypothetical protein KUTeg_010972 [Tegillarca granosa]
MIDYLYFSIHPRNQKAINFSHGNIFYLNAAFYSILGCIFTSCIGLIWIFIDKTPIHYQTMDRGGASQLKLQIQSICAKLASLGEESMFVSVNIRENLTNYAGSSLAAYSSEVCAIRFNDEKDSKPVQPQPITGTYNPQRTHPNHNQFNRGNQRPSPYKPGPRMTNNATTPPKQIMSRNPSQYPGRFPSPQFQSREAASSFQSREFGRSQSNNAFDRPKPPNAGDNEAPVGTKSIVYIGFDDDKKKSPQNPPLTRPPANRGRGTFPNRGMMGSAGFRPRNPQVPLRANLMARQMTANGNRPPGSMASSQAMRQKKDINNDDDCIIIDGDDPPPPPKIHKPTPPKTTSNTPFQIEMGQLPQYQNNQQKQNSAQIQNQINPGQVQQNTTMLPTQAQIQSALQAQLNRNQYPPGHPAHLQHNQPSKNNTSSAQLQQLAQRRQSADLQHNQLTQSNQPAHPRQSSQLHHGQSPHSSTVTPSQPSGSLVLPTKVSSTQPPHSPVQKSQPGNFSQFNQPVQSQANQQSQFSHGQVSNFQTKPSVQNPWGVNNPPIFPLGHLPIKIESIESTGIKVESKESLMLGEPTGPTAAERSQIMQAESTQQIKVENTETFEIIPVNVQPLPTPPDTPQVVIENLEGNPISDKEVMSHRDNQTPPDTTYKSEPETIEVTKKSPANKCKVCGKGFPTAAILKTHMSIHFGLRPYKCTVCGKQFSSLSYLNSHKKIHSGDKPHKCYVCDAQFSALQAFKVHMKTHSVEDKQKGDKAFQCETCGKQFTWMSNLKAHRKSHSGEKMHKCSTCGKELATLASLNNHVRTHTGDKPFKCEICGKKFIQAVQLKSHSRTHNKDKPYTCNICDMKFSKMNSMKVHLKKHQNE